MPVVEQNEPVLRFGCNPQGCCCKGWFIAFHPTDFARWHDAFSEDERAEVIRAWCFRLREDGSGSRFHFARSGEDGG